MFPELLMHEVPDRLTGFFSLYYRFQCFRFRQPEFIEQPIP